MVFHLQANTLRFPLKQILFLLRTGLSPTTVQHFGKRLGVESGCLTLDTASATFSLCELRWFIQTFWASASRLTNGSILTNFLRNKEKTCGGRSIVAEQGIYTVTFVSYDHGDICCQHSEEREYLKVPFLMKIFQRKKKKIKVHGHLYGLGPLYSPVWKGKEVKMPRRQVNF